MIIKDANKYDQSYNLLRCFADGGSRNNPGHSACGFVIKDEFNNILYMEGIYLGIKTNNVAEYNGLVHLLKKIKDFNVKKINIYLDSQLVVNQVNTILITDYANKFKCNLPELRELRDNCIETILAYNKLGISININLIKRELNSDADKIVNTVLDKAIEEVRKSKLWN